MKIIPVGAELLQADGRTDGRTDVTKLRVAFHQKKKLLKRLSETQMFLCNAIKVPLQRSTRP
jgi:hypothetical protein